jgi:hypothetical protein
MIGEYRFFHYFYDGQIVKSETEKYKLFKLVLVSVFSALGLFFVFAGLCNWAGFVLLELGMFWNIYSAIDKRMSLLLSVLVGVCCFFFAVYYQLYSNALIYVGCYIPLQLIALSKDYSEGSFVQIRKRITIYNKIIFIIFFVELMLGLYVFNFTVDGKYPILDALSAALLVCSALLRNERYFEYYVFRIFALIATISLWVVASCNVELIGGIGIICMYLSYLIFDVVTYFYQHNTYVNQYMIQEEKHNQILDQQLMQEKLEMFQKVEEAKNQNENL